MLGICRGTLRQLESLGVAVEVLPRPDAVETYIRFVGDECDDWRIRLPGLAEFHSRPRPGHARGLAR